MSAQIGEMADKYPLTEEQRQVTILALAELALSRPGWDMMLSEIAVALDGRHLFAEFKRLNADRVGPERLPLFRPGYPG